MAVIGLLGALYQKNLEPGPSLKKSWEHGQALQRYKIEYLRTSPVCSEN